MNNKTFLVLTALLLPSLASAEDEIQTDRPDFVESSNTVGTNRFQIETSVAYERDKNSDEKTQTFSTPTLLRLGIADNWELRLETDGAFNQKIEDRTSSTSTRDSGLADFALGFKWHQSDADEKTMAPSTAWIFHLDMPGGTDRFKSTKVRPSLRYVAEWEFANDFSLGVMPGLIYDVNDNNDRFLGGILGIVLGKSFSDNLRGFVEFGGQEIMRKKDGGSQLTFDMGLAYLVNPLTQLDIVYNKGLNQYTPDHTLGIGLSVKF